MLGVVRLSTRRLARVSFMPRRILDRIIVVLVERGRAHEGKYLEETCVSGIFVSR